MKTLIVKPNHTALRPANYGNKRNYRKIDLYLDGTYYGSTTWAETLDTAIQALLAQVVVTSGTKVIAEYAKGGKQP